MQPFEALAVESQHSIQIFSVAQGFYYHQQAPVNYFTCTVHVQTVNPLATHQYYEHILLG